MVSFLQRLALPFLMAAAPARLIAEFIQIMPQLDGFASVRLHRWSGRPGTSKRTVAQDRRRAAKARARRRAKRLGQA